MKVFSFPSVSLILISLLSCNRNLPNSAGQDLPFSFAGVLHKQGTMIYMYGTHTITNNDKTYALQSANIDLDLYIDQEVVVRGIKIKGYPVDDGPEFIDVKFVEKK